MDNYDATEIAYKNGYEQGRADAEDEIRILSQKRATLFEIVNAYERGKAAALKWIPVTERLPKKSGDYLAYCGDGYIGLLPYSTQYKLFNTFDGCGTKHAMAVTHWMPLPEPPKEGK